MGMMGMMNWWWMTKMRTMGNFLRWPEGMDIHAILMHQWALHHRHIICIHLTIACKSR
jgi:hypothetical protein